MLLGPDDYCRRDHPPAGFTAVPDLDDMWVCAQCRRPTREVMIALTEIKQGKMRCGFCLTGNHENCAYAIVNGDKGIIKCPCEAEPNRNHPPKLALDGTPIWHLPTCVDCRRRSAPVRTSTGKDLPAADIDPATARCVEEEDCRAYRQARAARNPLSRYVSVEDLPGMSGQDDDGAIPSSRRSRSGSTTTRSKDMAKNKATSDFRVKAGGGKGAKVLEAIKNPKNAGIKRTELADRVGCTVGRVGEVIRFTLAEGSAEDKAAVQQWLNQVPSRGGSAPEKVASKPGRVPAKTTASKTATPTAKKAPAAKKAATKPAAKKAPAKKAVATTNETPTKRVVKKS